jgi:hypothetical protein
MSKTRTTALLTRLAILAITAAAVLGAPLASAQSIEITPNVGYRWGGEIFKEDNPALGFDAKLKDSLSYGLIVDIPVTYHVMIELSADHQRTGLREDKLFVPADHGFDLDVNYYHIGIMGQFPGERVAPYVVAAIGVADLQPQTAGLSDTRRFSTSLAAGIKVPIAPHLAFRLEGRGYWSDTSSSRWETSNHHCNHDDDNCRDNGRDLVQGQVKVGFTIWF